MFPYELPSEEIVQTLPRIRFSREVVDRMEEDGFFESGRCELIDGELFFTSGGSPRYACTVQATTNILVDLFGAMRVRVRAPIEVSERDARYNLPEPDVALIAKDMREFANRHPSGHELLVAVGIAEGTADFDIIRKVPLYARAGVPECWILDLTRQRLFQYMKPDGEIYRQIHILDSSDSLTLQGRSETIRVADLLPGTV